MSGATVPEALREWAHVHEQQARDLRALAEKIENPPEGVTVEYHWPYEVRFVEPITYPEQPP